MAHLMTVLEFLRSNPAAATLFLYFVMSVLAGFKPKTDAEYLAMPKWKAIIFKACAAVAADPVKLTEILVTLLKLPKNAADGSQPDPTHVTVNVSTPPGADPNEVAKVFADELKKSLPPRE